MLPTAARIGSLEVLRVEVPGEGEESCRIRRLGFGSTRMSTPRTCMWPSTAYIVVAPSPGGAVAAERPGAHGRERSGTDHRFVLARAMTKKRGSLGLMLSFGRSVRCEL